MKYLKWLGLILVALVVISVVAGTIFLQRMMTAPNANIKAGQLILINKDDSKVSLAKSLAVAGVVTNEKVFYFLLKKSVKNIIPGYYELASQASMKSIADLINSGHIKLVKTVFPEGWRVEQMAVRLNNYKIVDYDKFVLAAKPLEGKLFPDTYLLNPVMTPAEIIKMMTDDYDQRTAGLGVDLGSLTVASIVEKEAANDADRAVIAGIYLNRLREGMALQSDPTVAYARDSINLAKLATADILAYSFWRAAKTSEFTSVKSDYNTYQTAALPPTPICNPGLASIKAALSPTASNYFYFLYGTDGKLHPAKTQAEHEQNIVKYMN